MPGIYIHFPFCKKRCNYCDFYSSTNVTLIENYLVALKNELIIRKNYLDKQTVETIYFGGGTPSLLEPGKIAGILDDVRKNFNISANPEITVEINPDDIYKEYFKELISAGINRVSIGVQSFDNEILKFLGRRHNTKQVYNSIENAKQAGFSNISIDLIYGIPGMELDLWKDSLKKVFSLEMQHLSAYHISFEEGTPLYKLLKSGKIEMLNEDESWKQFKYLHDYALEKGFEHYEISNLALPGKYSRHNSNYWNNVPYLGLGPSAHSFNGNSRQWNLAETGEYLNSMKNGILASEKEELTSKDKLNDYLITKLRTKSGIDLEYINRNFGESNLNHIIKAFEDYFPRYAQLTQEGVFLTLEGWFISDRIVSDLMI